MMRLATNKDLNRAVEILSAAYAENPTVIQTIRKNTPLLRNRLFRYQALEMILKKALYLSDNEQGLIAFYKPHEKRRSERLIWLKIKTLLLVTGLSRGLRAIRRAGKISVLREKTPCLYVWLLAVHPDTRGIQTIQELRDALFSHAESEGLPIYAETPMERTKNIYERFGFLTYNQLIINNSNVVWLMKRPVKKTPVSPTF